MKNIYKTCIKFEMQLLTKQKTKKANALPHKQTKKQTKKAI